MIASVRGILVAALPTQVTIEVQGVGYEVFIPLSSFDHLPSLGQEIRLLTHLSVREDAHTLYGFVTAGERDLFRLLLGTVTGIGPKLALKILSGMSPAAFQVAVAAGDVRALSKISGVGKKMAERIIVELRGKVAETPAIASTSTLPTTSSAEQSIRDAVSALVVLGYKHVEAYESVLAVRQALGADATVEEIIRASLKKGAE